MGGLAGQGIPADGPLPGIVAVGSQAACCTGHTLVMYGQSWDWPNDADCDSCHWLCHQLCLEVLLTCVCHSIASQPDVVDHCLA